MVARKTTTTAAEPVTSQRDRIEAQIAALQAKLAALPEAEPEPSGKSAPRRVRLSSAAIDALPLPPAGALIFWFEPDGRGRKISGFCVRVAATGAKSFMLQTRTRAGRPIKLSLGRHPAMSCEQARELAQDAFATIARGGDPAADRAAAREAEEARRKAETVADLWATFEREHLPRLRPSSRAAYTTWWTTALEPRIGRLKVRDLSRQQVERLHREIVQGHGSATANRGHAVLACMLALAIREGWRDGPSPAAGIRLAKEVARDRVLSDTELRRLVAALAASDRLEARVCEFLLSTGARKGEALTAKWSDFRDNWWIVPAEHSKSKRAVKRPLNRVAAAVLAKLARTATGGPFATVSTSALDRWWWPLRRDLGIDDVHLHDLRHVAASLALNSGVSIAGVGGMLGHGSHSASITSRYAHLADQQLAAAAGAVGDRLAELARTEPAGSA